MVREGLQGFTYIPSQVFFVQRKHIAELALKYRLPGVGDSLQLVEAGFLIAYGINYAAQYRRGADFVDKILKGAKPGELPIEQPTVLDLAINLQTAKTIGIKIPNSLLVQATKVIE